MLYLFIYGWIHEGNSKFESILSIRLMQGLCWSPCWVSWPPALEAVQLMERWCRNSKEFETYLLENLWIVYIQNCNHPFVRQRKLTLPSIFKDMERWRLKPFSRGKASSFSAWTVPTFSALRSHHHNCSLGRSCDTCSFVDAYSTVAVLT